MCRVLIVDDDAGTRKTLSDIMEIQGHKPTAVATGQEAINRALRSPPEIALVDLRLPDMSGFEVIRRLREISPDTQCVVITGFGTRKSAIQAINEGVDGYIEKPYNPDRLLKAVQSLADRAEHRIDCGVEAFKERLDDIYALMLKLNGFVRRHGETLAAHSQWLDTHEQEHEKAEREMRTLSSRLWALGGGGGLLGLIATILQLLDL